MRIQKLYHMSFVVHKNAEENSLLDIPKTDYLFSNLFCSFWFVNVPPQLKFDKNDLIKQNIHKEMASFF